LKLPSRAVVQIPIMDSFLRSKRRVFHPALAAIGIFLIAAIVDAQTYAPPASGDFGGAGPYAVFIDTLMNPIYPTANGQALIVSIYHPNASVDPSRPTIFFAHGYTTPIGKADDYAALLINLASWGYNVVFSPYEGGSSPNIPKRFDELTTGFEAAVAAFHLNTAQVGFAGHSYGGGFLPAIIQHEMMGLADLYRSGNQWGATAAFMFCMAPGYALSGGGDTGTVGSQAIPLPANLNVVVQVYNDDHTWADPRVAVDIFYNITTLNRQKDFLTVFSDNHGTPAQVANHFLPNTLNGQASTSLQAWAILRHIDALAAWTFTDDAAAGTIALGNGVPAQTNMGVWSDGVPVVPLAITDLPDGDDYFVGSYVVDWDSAANPRGSYSLANGPPQIEGLALNSGQVSISATVLLAGHTYVLQSSSDLAAGDWSDVLQFTAAQPSQIIPGAITNPAQQFWRVLAP
jgi:hypothetical protein